MLLLENGSGEEERLRGILDARTTLLVSTENLGYAGGSNLLLREALARGADAIYLLNNDAEATEGVLDEPLRLLAEPGVGFVESLILTADGARIDTAGHRHLTSGDVLPGGRDLPANAVTSNREILSGCAAGLLLRATMLRETGLFDEEFFLGYEDVDLTYRASMMGWRGILCSSSVVCHRLYASIDRIRDAAYYTRSQRNGLLAYLHNTPASVVAANLPWIAFKFAAVTGALLLSGQRWVLGVYWGSLWQVVRRWREVRRVRRERLARRQLSAFALWRRQENCLPAYRRLLSGRGKRKPPADSSSLSF